MPYEYDSEIKEKYNSIEEVCDRIDKELDEEFPWFSVLRKLVNRIRELDKEK